MSRHDFVLSLAVLFRGSDPIHQHYSSGLLIIVIYPKARFLLVAATKLCRFLRVPDWKYTPRSHILMIKAPALQ